MNGPPHKKKGSDTSPGFGPMDLPVEAQDAENTPPENTPGQRPRLEASAAEDPSQRPSQLGTLPFEPEREAPPRVVRLISNQKGQTLSIELQQGNNKIGRQRDGNHIVLVSGEISRFHAEIEVTPRWVKVRDLGSSNGTFVNKNRIHGERTLAVGDAVAFSEQFSFRLVADGGAPAAPKQKAGAAPEQTANAALEQTANAALEQTANAAPEQTANAAPEQRASVNPPLAAGDASLTSAARPAGSQNSSAAPVSTHVVGKQPGKKSRETRITINPDGSCVPEDIEEKRPAPADLEPDQVTPTTGELVQSRPPESPFDEESSLQAMASGVRASQTDTQPESPEVAALERERRQLSVLYQVSKRCMSAESLADLDRLLIEVLERIVFFDRGFITYQLPSGDWKLVMSPRGERWDRNAVRALLQTGLKTKAPIPIQDSSADKRLGQPGPGRKDSRLLLPLRSRSAAVGIIFLISSRPDAFDEKTVGFLSLFADIAALAVINCSRLESQSK